MANDGEPTSGLLECLRCWPGTWAGEGINHAGERFRAVLAARGLFGKSNLLLWFRATGLDGTIYHEELALIGPAIEGGLTMTSANSNIPFLQRFDAPDTSTNLTSIELRHGDHGRRDQFRETLALGIDQNQRLSVAFSWGMPGEELAERSAVTLSRSQTPPPPDAPLR
jgi:hypothetical protein